MLHATALSCHALPWCTLPCPAMPCCGAHCPVLPCRGAHCPTGSLKQRGLVLPLTANIYQPILAELREMSKDWATWTETVETLA